MAFWNRSTDSNPVGHSIVLATDGSGSMAGQKIEDAKKATIEFAKDVDLQQNELALVLFGQDYGDGNVQIVSRFTRNLEKIERAVRNFKACGGTPFLEAMVVSYNSLLRNANGKPVLVMITDGHPTDAPEEEILLYGRELKRDGVRIITVAIGSDAHRDFLKQLASSSEDFHFAKLSSQLTKTYKKIASGLVLARKRR